MVNSIYRTLMTADIHMSNKLPYACPGENDVTDRLRYQINLLSQIQKIAVNENVDSIMILGDLFDQSRVDPVTLTHTVEALNKTTLPIYILAGNHDANNTRGGRFVVEVFAHMKNKLIHYVDKPFHPKKYVGLIFWPLPFMSVKESEEKISDIYSKMNHDNINVLLFHNNIIGCEHLSWVCDDGLSPDLLCEKFDYAIGGHFHRAQIFGKKGNGLYVGSPMQHHFGEEGNSNVCRLIDFFDNGNAIFTPIRLDGPRFWTLVVDDFQFLFDDVSENWKKGDYVRFVVEATSSEFEKHKSLITTFIGELIKFGINASIKYKPVYHHKKRIESDFDLVDNGITLENSISVYVDSDTVVTDSLDKKCLKSIGSDILFKIRSRHGII